MVQQGDAHVLGFTPDLRTLVGLSRVTYGK